jgi:hypothetical protein
MRAQALQEVQATPGDGGLTTTRRLQANLKSRARIIKLLGIIFLFKFAGYVRTL